MPQRTRANGTNPLENARDSIEHELGRIRKQFRTQGRSLEKRIEKGRKELESRRKRLETRGRKQVKSLVADIRKNPVVKRAEALRKDAEKQLETGVESMLSMLQIASKGDVQKIDRKLKTLNKKLASLEKSEPAANA